MDKIQLTKVFGVYTIKNLLNGKQYIGSTAKSFSIRWKQWKYDLKRQTANRYLQNAWNKYGEENFEFSIVEIVEDKNKVLEREQHWLDVIGLNNLYNISPRADCPAKPAKVKILYCPICSSLIERSSDRYRKTCGNPTCVQALINANGRATYRINQRSIRPCPVCGNQRKECYTSKGKFSKYQKTCGNSTCISHLKLQKHQTIEFKAKISKARKGKPLTEEHKQKLSKARRGKVPWNKDLKKDAT